MEALLKELLRWAIEYIDQHNKRTIVMHTHARSRQIEPSSVRHAVEATNKWLERARRAVK